jgi:hypothetical protein
LLKLSAGSVETKDRDSADFVFLASKTWGGRHPSLQGVPLMSQRDDAQSDGAHEHWVPRAVGASFFRRQDFLHAYLIDKMLALQIDQMIFPPTSPSAITQVWRAGVRVP